MAGAGRAWALPRQATRHDPTPASPVFRDRRTQTDTSSESNGLHSVFPIRGCEADPRHVSFLTEVAPGLQTLADSSVVRQ